MNAIIEAVTTYFSGFWGQVELAGTAFSLLCVYLATKHNQWTWFFGILGVLCFGALFYEYHLYSDAGLQLLFFLPVQLWGFIAWRKMAVEASNKLVTTSLSLYGWFTSIGVVVLFTLLNGGLMAKFTDASFPYIDAWTTWMSIVAQILMIRKFWESWVFWVVMDVVAIGVYYAKELYVTSGLYVLFLGLAISGGIKWYRNYKVILA